MDYSNAISIFDGGLRFMHSLGFNAPIVRTETSKLAGDSLIFIYLSEAVGRQIEISYLAAQRGRPSAVAVFIIELGGKRFSVEDWLAVHGKATSIEFSTLQRVGLSERKFIERFCEDFKNVCEHELREIILGRDWEDVPIDWKGYR